MLEENTECRRRAPSILSNIRKLPRAGFYSRLAQKWVSAHLTYIKTGVGWLYLTTIIGLAGRKVIGWAPSGTMKAGNTTVAAFKMAIKNRPIVQPLLSHSGRGVQYACNGFRALLKKPLVQQSMGRKGNCWDNAVAESFFKTMKTEMVYHRDFKTKAEAKIAIFEYIEVWYNRQTRHSALSYLTPCGQEQLLPNNKMSA